MAPLRGFSSETRLADQFQCEFPGMAASIEYGPRKNSISISALAREHVRVPLGFSRNLHRIRRQGPALNVGKVGLRPGRSGNGGGKELTSKIYKGRAEGGIPSHLSPLFHSKNSNQLSIFSLLQYKSTSTPSPCLSLPLSSSPPCLWLSLK